MEYLIYVVMFVLLAYIFYRNFVLIKAYRSNKEYIGCYQALLSGQEDIGEKIDAFIGSQKTEEGANKGRLLKLYHELRDDLDYAENLEKLDLGSIFYQKGKVSRSKLNFNSDVFVWLFLCLGIARKNSKFDVLNTLAAKIDALDMDNRLEVNEARAIYNALSENDISGVDFLNDILEGNYIDYEYDKNLIALYKRFAACTLAYSGEPIDDYYREDIRAFASTMVGQSYMKNLEIYEKYPPVVLDNQEENKE